MDSPDLQKIGLVAFVLRDGLVSGWPGHHREIQDVMVQAGCEAYVTSILPPSSQPNPAKPPPPEALRFVLSGGHSRAAERGVVFWQRDAREVRLTERAVPGKPGDRVESLREFSADELPRRILQGSVFVLIEREINLLTYMRTGGQCREVVPLSAFLADHRVSLVVHTASKNLRRWETNPKRAWLSHEGRVVVALWSWNATGHAEPRVPWRVFSDERPLHPVELDALPYARLGVVDIGQVLTSSART